jgi:hypothetical protein
MNVLQTEPLVLTSNGRLLSQLANVVSIEWFGYCGWEIRWKQRGSRMLVKPDLHGVREFKVRQ